MVSVIIPTKNEEEYLPKLLDSLKQQTFKDFEVIVGDANSTDKTVEIAQQFGAKVVKGGMCATGRNNGAKVAKGEVFLFLDADVILPADFIKKVLQEMQESKADFATALMEPINKDWRNRISHSLGNFFYRFQSKGVTPGFCAVIKAELFKKIGGYDESLYVMEDFKFASEASKQGKFLLVKGTKVGVSDRRMQRDGWLTTLFRTTLIIGYTKLFGFSRKRLFNYQYKDY